ncbi:hypothetical protein K474DRAFT_937695 [Panus rudis PR-1116 ss-1]|nr:hypothetical protein K474DRAFT_937695 [Panus rudis PR-1116 ss-1]
MPNTPRNTPSRRSPRRSPSAQAQPVNPTGIPLPRSPTGSNAGRFRPQSTVPALNPAQWTHMPPGTTGPTGHFEQNPQVATQGPSQPYRYPPMTPPGRAASANGRPQRSGPRHSPSNPFVVQQPQPRVPITPRFLDVPENYDYQEPTTMQPNAPNPRRSKSPRKPKAKRTPSPNMKREQSPAQTGFRQPPPHVYGNQPGFATNPAHWQYDYQAPDVPPAQAAPNTAPSQYAQPSNTAPLDKHWSLRRRINQNHVNNCFKLNHPLTEDNYPIWSTIIKCALQGVDLFGYCTGDIAEPHPSDPRHSLWESADSTVKAVLMSNMSSDVAARLNGLESASAT